MGTRLLKASLGASAYGDHQLASQVWLWAKVVAVPGVLMLLGLFLRTYNLEELGTVPDTYERLFDASRIASGQFPASRIYPPGASLVLAPFFVILPDSLATMQAVIIASGVALIGVSYAWVLRLTGDRLASSLMATAVAACPVFLFASRDAFFDMFSVLAIAASLFLLPMLRNQRMLAFVGYGVLLALLVNMRPTSAVIIPALLFLWLDTLHVRLELREVLRALITAPVLTAAAVFTALCVLSVLTGNWFGGSSNAPLNLAGFASRTLGYTYVGFYGAIGLVTFVPLVLLGLAHLWRVKRVYFYVFVYLIVVWPLAHAPFDFFNYRYVLPVLLVVFLVSAIGASSILKGMTAPQKSGRMLSGFICWCLLIVGLQFTIGSDRLLADWPKMAPQTDAGLAREFRPAIAAMEPESLVVSAVARAFWDANGQIEYLDLLDHHIAWGTDDASLSRLTSAVEEHLASGAKVYYLYSHWEGGHDLLGRDGREKYFRYYETLDQQFRLTLLQHSEADRSGLNPWILYSVEVKDSSSSARHSPNP